MSKPLRSRLPWRFAPKKTLIRYLSPFAAILAAMLATATASAQEVTLRAVSAFADSTFERVVDDQVEFLRRHLGTVA